MDNSELIEEIDKWSGIFQQSNDTHLYELAFFKIFVKFEKFLAECFEGYCIGDKSAHNYSPNRKLNFADRSHLHKVLKCNGGGNFINHSKIIKDISACFFDDNENPFNIITTDPTHSNLFNQMILIRNVIAHESGEAIIRYQNTVLGNNKPYLPPNDYLLSKKRGITKSYYTIYVEAIIAISNYIIGSNITPVP